MMSKQFKLKSLRNILESPINIQCLRQPSEDIVSSLKDTLKELLPAAKLEELTPNLPFKAGSQLKRKNEENITKRTQNIYRTFLAPGFQSVVRGLERKDLCCVIVASDIKPDLLQKLIFAYAQTASIPVIVVPDLRDITKYTLGFSTMTLGFMNVVAESEDNKFHPIFKIIVQNPTICESLFKPKHNEEIMPTQDHESSSVSQSLKPVQVKSRSLYVYREKCNKRVFTPCKKLNTEIISKTKERKNKDFISLADSSSLKMDQPSIIKELPINYDDNDDDDDCASDDNLFFVDRKRDESLINLAESNSENNQANKIKFKSKNFIQFEHRKNQKSKYPVLSKKKNILNEGPKLKPLHIKVVGSNPKKNRRKKKKKSGL